MSEKIISEFDCIINELWFKDGTEVLGGAEIMQVESLKMMIPIHCKTAGKVKYHVNRFDYILTGTLLAEIISAS